ncbi:MAG: polyhydroxyalkanoate synthesis repressor PhaR [Alphaproteobacteria bacterium]|nr:polyhydroxyalkanoate synthesis repressor PhaR [Alphaproteobacteria bacterium]MDD9920338.1 polyhydroxyalkanoate synthesis repressor PhaR [Alphaproteobacteria bacterium]
MAEPVIIKKYANRRLYNTETSTYITLDELSQMVRDGRDFEVVDAKSGQDLTRQVLAQILLEEETKGAAMLPVRFLRQLISFYDNSMQTVLPHYLETTMDVFIQNQQRIREQTDSVLGSFSPFEAMENMQALQRQQIEKFQSMVGLFNPFLKPEDKDQQIAELSQKIQELNAELERLKR